MQRGAASGKQFSLPPFNIQWDVPAELPGMGKPAQAASTFRRWKSQLSFAEGLSISVVMAVVEGDDNFVGGVQIVEGDKFGAGGVDPVAAFWIQRTFV